MKLHESQDDITNVLAEEAEGPGAAGSAAAINSSDFAIESLDIPQQQPEVEKKEEPAAASAEVKKETVTQQKEITGPGGEKIIEKTVVTTQATAPSEKSEAVARLFNPTTALLMFDIFLTRVGGVFTPERPREYWSLTPQDRKDLSTLLTESAKEEQWTGIPTKWLLLGSLGLMIGGKVVYAKKLQYKWVPGEKDGDPKTGSSGGSSSSTSANDSDYKSLFIREKAKHEVEMGIKNNSEEVIELKKQNEYLFRLIEKAKLDRKPGGGISDAHYEDFPEKQERTSGSIDHIFKDSQDHEWDLDMVEFTDKEALLDKTKAGLPGWSPTGIKLGNISAGQHEAFAEWKRYRKNKKMAA